MDVSKEMYEAMIFFAQLEHKTDLSLVDRINKKAMLEAPSVALVMLLVDAVVVVCLFVNSSFSDRRDVVELPVLASSVAILLLKFNKSQHDIPSFSLSEALYITHRTQ